VARQLGLRTGTATFHNSTCATAACDEQQRGEKRGDAHSGDKTAAAVAIPLQSQRARAFTELSK